MRDQLLCDSDWAGMTHSLEIRTPLVDVGLLERVAPCGAGLAPGEGKRALAKAPSKALPETIVNRAKTGFGVPTGKWMARAVELPRSSERAPTPIGKGATSRRWAERALST